MFDFNPLEVGNFSAIGCYENDQELKVNQLVNDIPDYVLTAYNLTNEMQRRGIDYFNLPPHLKAKINTIELI